MGVLGTLGTYFGSGDSKAPEKINKNLKIYKRTVDKTPESKFKKASMIDRDGEMKKYNRAEVKKAIAGMVHGGITTSKLEKNLKNRGMVKKQMELRKGVMSELSKVSQSGQAGRRNYRAELTKNNLRMNLSSRLRDEGISKLLVPDREEQAREKIENIKHGIDEEQQKETDKEVKTRHTIADYSKDDKQFSVQKNKNAASIVPSRGNQTVSTGTTLKADSDQLDGSANDPLGSKSGQNNNDFKTVKNQQDQTDK